jgi:hypothetical protein
LCGGDFDQDFSELTTGVHDYIYEQVESTGCFIFVASH